MFLIANLVAYYAMKERAAEFGMSGEMLAKNDLVIDGGLRSLEICKRAGVPVAYGSDLLGQLQIDQSREFALRSQVLRPIEIIRAATLIGARVLRHEGRLGCLTPGAFADLLVIDGNPLQNLDLLAGQGRHMAAIMKDGRFHKIDPTLSGSAMTLGWRPAAVSQPAPPRSRASSEVARRLSRF